MKRILIRTTLFLAFFVFFPIFHATVSAADDTTIKEIASGLEYDWIDSFNKGLAPVEKNDELGYIDRTGKEVIPLAYDFYRFEFTEELLVVYKDGKYGCIDKTGNVVVPFVFAKIEPFKEGMAAVSEEWEGQYGKGRYIHWGFVDKTGTIVIPCEYDNAASFSEGLAAVRKEGGKWGYINTTGEVMVPFAFDRAFDFNEGLALVSTWDYSGENFRENYGFIDKTGNIVIPLVYELAFEFSEGLAGVMKNKKSGYIDKMGNVVIPFVYDSHNRPFSEGLANVLKDGKWGYIDKTGQVVIPFAYHSAEAFSDGMAAVSDRSGKYGFIDKTGKLVVPCAYDQVFDFKNGLALVGKDESDTNLYIQADNWMYIDKTGKVVTPVAYYESYPPFSEGEGLISMKKDDTWSIFQVVMTKNIEVTFGATRYMLNGEPFAQQTMVYNGVAYLPAAYLAEKLGLTAKWDSETNTTTLTSTGAESLTSAEASTIPNANPVTKNITAAFGSTQYMLNGEPFDETTIVYDGVAYLPAAYLASKLGLTAQWDTLTNITTLTSIAID